MKAESPQPYHSGGRKVRKNSAVTGAGKVGSSARPSSIR